MRRSLATGLIVVAGCQMLAFSAASAAGLSPQETAAKVNSLLAADLGKASQTAPVPSQKADEETFLRRVSLDLVGLSPTPEQITAFVLDPAGDKRPVLVARLLASEDYGRNWGRYWRDVIMYRRSDDRSLMAAGAAEKFLTAEINRGAGWHDIARAFITATGDVQEDGSTALIMAQMGEAEEVTAEVSRIFMGVQIQCAQCHDHPTDRWKRQQFHELAAFFPRISVRPKLNSTPRSFEVASTDFAPRFAAPGGMRRGSLEHYMPDPKDASSKGTLVQPKFFVTNRKADEGLKDVERRTLLANWMGSSSNPWFAKAYVNRMWGELVGEGFYEPIDDLGPDRHCSAPQTIEFLADEFTKHQYDMRWLLASIASTDAYQLQSRSRRNPDDAPFNANCPQRLRADQLYDALLSALGIDDFAAPAFGGGGGQQYRGIRGPRQLFGQTFGYDPSTPRDEVAGSIPQALYLMNSPLVQSAIDGDNRRTALGKLLADVRNDEAVVVELYLRCLAREPKTIEIETCLKHVRDTGTRTDGFEDVLWALINSTEFTHRK